MNTSWIAKTTKGIAFAGMFLSLALLMRAQPATDSAAINKQLVEVRTHSVLADDDAATLDSYTRSPMSWESHLRKLETIKEHTNDLINDYNQLSSMREQGSPWQQEAIDRINPLLHEMADQLHATIDHLNANRERVHMQPYCDYVHANYKLIHKAHQLISDFVDYSESKAKATSLEKELSLPIVAIEGK